MPKISNIQQRPIAVDLFAGAGGFSLGIEQAGFDVLVAVENDPVHAATYAFNFPLTTVLCADASTLTGSAIRKAAYRAYTSHHPASDQGWNGQIDLVFGGPPCQGFSIIGKRLVNDERNSLVFHFYRLVAELNPRYFVMENVPGMATGNHQTWLRQLKTLFKKAGYKVQVGVLNAADCGVPQQRKRLFLIGTQVGGDSAESAVLGRDVSGQSICPENPLSPPPQNARQRLSALQPFGHPAAGVRAVEEHLSKKVFLPKAQVSADVLGQILCPKNQHKLVSKISGVSFPPKLCVTVGDAIADLPDLDNFPELKTTDEVLLSASTLLQIKQKTSFYAQILRGELPEDHNFSYSRLWNPQLLTSSMQTQHNENSISRFAKMLPNQREPISHLRRLDINGLCHTLRAGTGHERGSYTSPRPIHPTHPRVISVREAARLHSFPDWFRFHQTKWHGFRQVGNAVPPLLAKAVGRQIVASLGIMPSASQEPIELGDIQLLRFDRSEATHYWKSFACYE